MMKKLILALALACGACTTIPTPGTVANQTVLDEKARITAGLLYVTASTLGNSLSRAGLIDRPRFQALDQSAYAALLRVRAAYDAGNATSFKSALDALHLIIGDINKLVGR